MFAPIYRLVTTIRRLVATIYYPVTTLRRVVTSFYHFVVTSARFGVSRQGSVTSRRAAPTNYFEFVSVPNGAAGRPAVLKRFGCAVSAHAKRNTVKISIEFRRRRAILKP